MRDSAKYGDVRQRISAQPSVLPAIVELLCLANTQQTEAGYLAEALGAVRRATGAALAVLAVPHSGDWSVVAKEGRSQKLPEDLFAEVLDSEAPSAAGRWAAAPLVQGGAGSEVLAVYGAAGDPLQALDSLAAAMGVALATIRSGRRQQQRIQRLETILEISNDWNQTREMEPLLAAMAQAATRLFAADRASIFLWDRPGKTLVGRPALGVEGGELRIAQDTGVVGEVVQTGETRRVGRAADQDAIDRSVDEQLGYKTETLLCVPLRGAGGKPVGAFELVNKLDGDFTDDDEAGLVELAGHAATALENTQALEQLASAHRQLVDQAAEGAQLIGKSPAVAALRSTIARVAQTDLAVLILGENGTGKEVASQSIHYLSSRRQEPFVAVNCAALPENLLESELFGHEKGAFTDARETRQGKFELADGGTLFLDEIGDLSLGGQAKLLRVLEEKVVVRVGGSVTIRTDARVIAATNQKLGEMVAQKRFREDLYFRLNVVVIEIPPLRQRGDDILLLAEHFLADFSAKAGREVPPLTAAARKRLRAHPWPGNVRELRNLMERLAYLAEGDKIDADDLAFIAPGSSSSDVLDRDVLDGDLTLTDATNRFQEQYIHQTVNRTGGNMSEAAGRLGLHRSNLYRKMRQLGMSPPE